jgi:prepilin-type N-terminal cleavage/methylation domain-containing protein
MLPHLHQDGFTLVELLIVIAIVAILVSIAIPMMKTHTEKAKLTELTNSMSATAAALAAYYQDNDFQFPAQDQTTILDLRTTLGVSIPNAALSRINSVFVAANTGTIQFQVRGVDSSVDNSSLILSPTTTNEGAIVWSWGGSAGFPQKLIPIR